MVQTRSGTKADQSIFEVAYGKQRGNIMVNRCSQTVRVAVEGP